MEGVMRAPMQLQSSKNLKLGRQMSLSWSQGFGFGELYLASLW